MDHQPSAKTAPDPHGDNFGSRNLQSTADGSGDLKFRPRSPSTFIQKQHPSETTKQQDQSHPTDPATELIEKPIWHDAQTTRRPGQVFGAKGIMTDYWLLELLSWTFSALCLAAIILVLRAYDNKPLPHWPYKVTLNSVVSILATAANASMLLPVVEALSQLKWDWFSKSNKLADFESFDAASRGPLGSIQLIIGLKGRHLASLGATITVVALAFNPFLQQIITYPLKPIPSSNSTLARSDTYANDTDLGTFELNLFMKGAVYSGIYSPQPPGSGLEYSCSSGNCTWDTYDTVGVCSTCQDVSSQLKPNCSQVHQRAYSYDVCSYMLPNSIVGLSGQGIALSTSTTQLYNTSDIGLANVATSLSFPHITDPIVDFYTLWYPDASATNTPWDMNVTSYKVNDVGLPLASECVLYWCGKKLKSTVLNGTYDEVVLDSWGIDTSSFAMNSTGFSTFKSPLSGSTLAIDLQSRRVMANYMTRFLNAGLVNVDGPFPFSNNQIYSSDVVQTIYLNLNTSRTNNLTGLVGNLATSMTNSLRSMNNGNGPLLGTTIHYQTYVHIRWAWISLPAALLLLTLGYLVIVIVKSNIQNNPIWKSSTLAVLFHGLDPTTRQELGRLQRKHEMDRQAEIMKIRLSEGDEGLRLLRDDTKNP